jgi:alkaline phosphatase D
VGGRRGRARALPQLAHSVHVEVDGLRPDREWFYRFRYRHDLSPTGRTRTAPRPSSNGGTLAFAFASCQAWDNGYDPSYRHLAREDLDLVLHLGDYGYEGGIPADGGYRQTPTPEVLRAAPRDLERWRLQYALYKTDPDLQAAHAHVPWVVTWDDQRSRTTTPTPGPSTRATSAPSAPPPTRRGTSTSRCAPPATPDADGPQVYRRLHWGRLAQLDVIDGRQFRSVPPCGWGEAQACPDAYDPSVTMLGQRQERWLDRGFAESRARWNILTNNVMVARPDPDGPAGELLWHDASDGFPAARNRLTRAWVQHQVSNPVVVTGDWHSTFVNDIKRDFDDPPRRWWRRSSSAPRSPATATPRSTAPTTAP